MSIIEEAKKYFHKMVQDFNSDPYGLVNHLKEMEKWATGDCTVVSMAP
ncbi:MAG: hypothetical protein UT64_C0005G0017 [Candidatus Falkowbacteria bacterium GW2011_GWF2_39_8]|uniref:Uncharacterized protein n=1 Tax=Candidatus Falkowbacteria bacterium GW2011_GWF2_39_8 TaxID=1618642 RepID=A0A0G0T731_9BACT|nr:MAG: hypothetical protein UT64_C0005G0017 [Candidatus Falkowbacteria bacterium GW2011_GWF2_39_8]